jgi:hypothetical protein
MPELKMASRIRICSGRGFHRGLGSGVRSSPPTNQETNRQSVLEIKIPSWHEERNPTPSIE